MALISVLFLGLNLYIHAKLNRAGITLCNYLIRLLVCFFLTLCFKGNCPSICADGNQLNLIMETIGL